MAKSQPLVQSKQLLLLVAQRLRLMQEVAHYKAVHHLPLHVPEVEAKLLAEVARQARDLGISSSKAQATIALQMRLGVYIQQQWCEQWQHSSLPLSAPKDLNQALRPQLNRLTHEILQQIAKARAELASSTQLANLHSEYQQLLHVPFLSEEQKFELLESLIDVVT